MSAIEAVLFSLLMAMVVVWFGLILWTFRRLRTKHPETYEAIGSPSLFWNNSMRNNWMFLKFLYGSEWLRLSDRPLSLVARMMQVLLVAYIVVFGWPAVRKCVWSNQAAGPTWQCSTSARPTMMRSE